MPGFDVFLPETARNRRVKVRGQVNVQALLGRRDVEHDDKLALKRRFDAARIKRVWQNLSVDGLVGPQFVN